MVLQLILACCYIWLHEYMLLPWVLKCRNKLLRLELKFVRVCGAWCNLLHLTDLHIVNWSAFLFSVSNIIQIWLDRFGTYLNWILSNCKLNCFFGHSVNYLIIVQIKSDFFLTCLRGLIMGDTEDKTSWNKVI